MTLLDAIYDDQYPLVLDGLWTAFEHDHFRVAETSLATTVAKSLNLRDVNEFAEKWARERAGSLISGLSSSAEVALQRIMAKSFREGWSEAETTQAVAGRIGLTDQYAQAVETYRQGLLAKGTPRGQAWNMSKKYADQLRYARAKRIASTETVAAFTAAKQELWKQAVLTGEVDPTSQRKWVTSRWDRKCPTCKSLNGKTVPLQAGVYSASGRVVHGPPLHPNCRCYETLTTAGGLTISPTISKALVEIQKFVKCLVCGKQLHSEESKKRGIGPSHLTSAGKLTGPAKAAAKKRGADIASIMAAAEKVPLSDDESQEKADAFPPSARILRVGFHWYEGGAKDKARLQKLGLTIPPAYKYVQMADSPTANTQAIGYDDKGRRQPRMHPDATAAAKAEKFERIRRLAKVIDILDSWLEHHATWDQEAGALAIMRYAGVRPASKAKTGAEEQAYGATTMLTKHVKIKNGVAYFDFPAKDGVEYKIQSRHPLVIEYLEANMEGKGPNDQIFDTTDKKTNDWLEETIPGFTNKDFRTYHGTSIAFVEVAKWENPTTAAEAKAIVKAVSEEVARQLSNTPKIALESYISPDVWLGWDDEFQP